MYLAKLLLYIYVTKFMLELNLFIAMYYQTITLCIFVLRFILFTDVHIFQLRYSLQPIQHPQV